MRRLTTFVASVLVLGALAISAASPAGAGCEVPPRMGDIRAQKAGQPFVGGGMIGGIFLVKTLDVGDTAEFRVRLRNDALQPRDLYIKGFPTGSVNVSKYRLTGKDVTAAVLDSDGKRFRDVPPGDSTPAVVVRWTAGEHFNGNTQTSVQGYNEKHFDAECSAVDTAVLNINDRSTTP